MALLRSRLSAVGVKRKFLDEVVLPSWWDDSIADSEGGLRERAGYICAHLGFSLRSLLDDSCELTFADQGGVRFGKARSKSAEDMTLATNYALRVARSVAVAFVDEKPALDVLSPETWSEDLLGLSDKPLVFLRHVVDASWRNGVPVIPLRNIQNEARKPDALTTMIGDRPVILILNTGKGPSWTAFVVAHELGHVHHRHLKSGQTIVSEKIDIPKEESGFTTRFRTVDNGDVSLPPANDDTAIILREAMATHLNSRNSTEDSWEWICRATGCE